MMIRRVLTCLFLVGPLYAAAPSEPLSFRSVTHWAGDLPSCVRVSDEAEVCTWVAPEHTFFTCAVNDEGLTIDEQSCVYETLSNRKHKFPAVPVTEKSYRFRREAMNEWNRKLARVADNVGVDSNFTRVIQMVGHGPNKCVLGETLICVWVSDNATPGHRDSLRDLATEDMENLEGNNHIKLLCEFDRTSFQRTEDACIARYF